MRSHIACVGSLRVREVTHSVHGVTLGVHGVTHSVRECVGPHTHTEAHVVTQLGCFPPERHLIMALLIMLCFTTHCTLFHHPAPTHLHHTGGRGAAAVATAAGGGGGGAVVGGCGA